MKAAYLYLCLIAAVLCGCSADKPEPPRDLIPEDQYIHILVEYEMVQSFEFMHGDSVNVRQLVDSVMQHYGVSRKQFERSHNFYQQDVQAQKERYKKALETLRQEMVRMEDQRNKKDGGTEADTTATPDSLDHSTQ